MNKMQNEILIIGYGNPLRGDDGLGYHLIQCIERGQEPSIYEIGSHIETRACQQLTPELAEPISQVQGVIFVDARVGDGNEHAWGTLFSETITPAMPASSAFSHYVDPATLLALAQMLYGTCPQALLLSVVGQSFGYNEQLSAVVQARVPDLLHCVHTWIEQFQTVGGC